MSAWLGLARLALRRTLGHALAFGAFALVFALARSELASPVPGEDALARLAAVRRETTWGVLLLALLPLALHAAARTCAHWRAGDRSWLGPRAHPASALAAAWAGTWAGASLACALVALCAEAGAGGGPAPRLVRELESPRAALVRAGERAEWTIADLRTLAGGNGVRLDVATAPGSGPAARVRFAAERGGVRSEREVLVFGRLRVDLALPEGEGPLAFSVEKLAEGCAVVLAPGALELLAWPPGAAAPSAAGASAVEGAEGSEHAANAARLADAVDGAQGAKAASSAEIAGATRTLDDANTAQASAIENVSGLALAARERAGSLALLARAVLFLGAWTAVALACGAWMGAGTATCLALALALCAASTGRAAPWIPGADLAVALAEVGDGLVPPALARGRALAGLVLCALLALAVGARGLDRAPAENIASNDFHGRGSARRWRRRLAFAAALFCAVLWLVPDYGAARAPSAARVPWARLCGPLAGVAADVQWVRVQSAIQSGEHELALARSETALALDPASLSGWRLVARHLALYLGSHEREPDPARRLALVRAGLAVLERGEAAVRDPAPLAFERGVLLFVHAEEDPDLPWPGGRGELLAEAARAFERAAELGAPEAGELARAARERMDAVTR